MLEAWWVYLELDRSSHDMRFSGGFSCAMLSHVGMGYRDRLRQWTEVLCQESGTRLLNFDIACTIIIKSK
jgi:hypothetical protein